MEWQIITTMILGTIACTILVIRVHYVLILPLMAGMLFYLAALGVWLGDPYESVIHRQESIAYGKCKDDSTCIKMLIKYYNIPLVQKEPQ